MVVSTIIYSGFCVSLNKKSLMRLLILNCVLLGFSVGFLFFLLWKNEFMIMSQSSDFIAILAFVFLIISFFSGIMTFLLRNKNLLKKGEGRDRGRKKGAR